MKKILLIDDSIFFHAAITEILNMQGFEVLVAEDGTTGIKLAQEQRPDLILCDMTMPDLSGYDVLSALRQTPPTENIPFIFVTGNTEVQDVKSDAKLAADYLMKPFTLNELVTLVSSRVTP